jgi:hypothetical protein
VAARIMQSDGIMIIDLYGCALSGEADIQQPQNVHFLPHELLCNCCIPNHIEKTLLILLLPQTERPGDSITCSAAMIYGIDFVSYDACNSSIISG